jgi:hypothetical protein
MGGYLMAKYKSEEILFDLQFNAEGIRAIGDQLHDADILDEPTAILKAREDLMVTRQMRLCKKYLMQRMLEIDEYGLPVEKEVDKMLRTILHYGYPCTLKE